MKTFELEDKKYHSIPNCKISTKILGDVMNRTVGRDSTLKSYNEIKKAISVFYILNSDR